MCTGAELAPLIASAVGTGISMDAQNDAARDQARAAGDRARLAGEANRRAGARVSEEVSRLKDSTSQGEQQTAENDFMAALRNAAARDSGGAVSDRELGNVSERFAQDQAASKRKIRAGNRGAAHQLASIDAPFMQRVREGAGASRAASDLSVMGNAANGDDFLQQLRMSLIRPNAAQMAAGSLISSGAQAYAGRAQPAKKSPTAGMSLVDTGVRDTRGLPDYRWNT